MPCRWPAGRVQTTEILFDTWVQGQASPYSQPCYLPKTGDVLVSTNG